MIQKKIISALSALLLSASVVAASDGPEQRPAAIRFIDDWGRTTRSMMRGASGYIPVGDKFAVGPVASFIGYNTLEGFRLGAGLSTTASLSRHMAVRGYGAYGFGDHRWKYMGEAEWSIHPVNGYFGAYRVNSIKARFSYDTEALGDNTLSTLPSRAPFRLSLRRNEMLLYHKYGSVSYNYEPSTSTEVGITAMRERYYPTRYIGFGDLTTLDAWRMSLEAGWRPGGDFFQAVDRRIDVKPYAPQLRARIQWVKGASASDVTDMMIAELTASKVTHLGTGGFTLSVLLHGAVTAGYGAYPFLPSLPSSPYVLRRFGAFALLKPMELPADRFADAHLRIDDGGMLLGMIPGVRMLGFTTTASFDVGAGSLSSRTNPARSHHDLPELPYNPVRNLSWGHPYSEIGVGFDRILGIGRLEYVWRLGYKSNPGVRTSGIALGIDIMF